MYRNYNIKPIKTRYKGILFRSKLEARFAYFFDQLRLSWKYETRAYKLPALGWYLPDFTLSNIFVEVKPTYPLMIEINKMRALCHGTTRSGCILFGSVAPPRINMVGLNRLFKSGKDVTHSDILKNISGALMLKITKDGNVLPDYYTFGASDNNVGIYPLYLNPEVTFERKERTFDSYGMMIEGVKVLAVSSPFNGGTFTNERIYSGSGVVYDLTAYEKVKEKFRKRKN